MSFGGVIVLASVLAFETSFPLKGPYALKILKKTTSFRAIMRKSLLLAFVPVAKRTNRMDNLNRGRFGLLQRFEQAIQDCPDSITPNHTKNVSYTQMAGNVDWMIHPSTWSTLD